MLFIKERNEITSVSIQKFRFRKRQGWREDSIESVRLTPVTFEKVLGFLQFLAGLDLASIHERRIALAHDALPEIDPKTRQQIRTLIAQAEGPAIVEELLKSGAISSKDIVNVGYRKAQLREFKRLLNDSGYVEEYKQAPRRRSSVRDPVASLRSASADTKPLP